MDQDDQSKPRASKDSVTSMVVSLLLGAVLLVFGVQDLANGKMLLGVILTVAGVVNLFVAYKIWGRRRHG